MSVPSVLASAMADRGLTAAQLARAAGIAPNTISNALTGTNVPSVRTLRLLEDVLGTSAISQEAVQHARCALQTCRRRFVKGRPWQRYCRRRCAARAQHARRAETDRRTLAIELRAVRDDVDRMCSDCVGASLVCLQSDCPLRRWSPYPLVTGRGA